MFKKLFAALSGRRHAAPPLPYRQDELNLVYQLLFCDDPQLVKASGTPASLFGSAPDPRVVQTIGEDPAEESRVRLLAWHWLRAAGQPVASRELLGVVVEVPLDQGLDVLAAYADGSVRYINHTGRVAVFEGAPDDVARQARLLVQTALPLAVKGTTKGRTAPPVPGNVRLSLLAADGMHVREGSFGDIERDKLAAPVLQEAQRLLDAVVRQRS
ncbi:hypothetical protein IP92_01682 [Pseudoduganella flava]|uniref:Uncharacterized protein n=1 Tax=Pseudoduganella flava TaxID=871742 RepID=A0A562PV47_9BURK|nr:hypothetical protein [Pseudoduganella flava]QGZ39419.1 hypothetical protein GO485_10410 [Pseudoduganella flava]TWI48294.1 hypothetical protein IP92_01682 [Pseudoduganella flava]